MTNSNSPSPVTPPQLFRRYVNDYINRHDFSVLPAIMTDDYTLFTSGHVITGRDGPYQTAVARQLDQFPGLMFTPHDMLWSGNRLAVRFTEHGASKKHANVCAAWPSIAIYTMRNGLLASCEIEQDYLSRRNQLEHGLHVSVDSPVTAPWDLREVSRDAASEAVVLDWLQGGSFLSGESVQVDDSNATGEIDRIIDGERIDVTAMLSGDGKVAFHAVQHGTLAGDFAPEIQTPTGSLATIHLSGLVHVDGGSVRRGNVIRDRWGLYRRLAA